MFKTLIIKQETINEKAKKYKFPSKYLESFLESADFKKSNENCIFKIELKYKYFTSYTTDLYDVIKHNFFALEV